MRAARKIEVFPVEDNPKKDDVKNDEPFEKTFEIRLVRLEDHVANIAGDVVEIKGDLKDLRTRMDDGFQSVRKEMRDGDQALRKEMHDGDQALGKEMKDGFQAVRKEMNDGFQAVRKEMNDGFQSIAKELSSISKELSNAKIWALLIAAAILGVLARSFHWI
jgi:hypothetical protein